MSIFPLSSWLKLGRWTWLALALFTLYSFVSGIPRSFATALRMSMQTRENLLSLGFSLSAPAYALIVVDALSLTFFLAVASLLVWRRGNDPGALVVAFMLLCTGGLYTDPTANAALPPWALAILPGLAETFQAWFIYLFPTGRPVPRWVLFPLLLLPLWRVGIWMVDYVPHYQAITHTVENYSYTPQAEWDIVLFMLILTLGVASQVYRYRRISTPLQRQQTKWVLFGVALTLAFVGIYVLVFNVWGYARQAPLLIAISARGLRQMALSIVPAVTALAVLRYHLWDIDFAINRSLVYAALTAALAGFFGVWLMILSRFFSTNLAPWVALGLALLFFGVFFQPLRRASQRFVDKNFYHILIEYQKPRLKPLDAASFPKAQFSEYAQMQLIGRGGMAEVYSAQHPVLRQPVAIKVMRQSLENLEAQRSLFEREIQLLRGLVHPNIIRILDAGEVDSRPYLVMELVDGPTLSALLEKERLDYQTIVLVLQGLASALDYLHIQKIIHRDIKPANILLDQQGGELRPVLTDFGLAKLLGETSAISHSGVAGTFAYIAPEQIQTRPDLDGRADLYALGVMAFQLLTGDLPFRHENSGALLIAHMLHPAPDARQHNPSLSAQTAAALQKAMAKDPSLRYASAAEFIAALALSA